MSEPLLQVKHLSAGYGETAVLREIAFEIHSGELIALVGSNGAGKTTLLRALSRLIPSKGHVSFAGYPLDAARPEQAFKAGLVQVPEGRQLFEQMTTEENLLMGAYCRIDNYQIKVDLERVYKLFPRLKERRQQLAGSLSGGEQQMCAIARGLMAAPRLLMIDELSLGLAPLLIDQLLNALTEINKTGVTILLVEQDVFSALSIANRAYILETGRIVRSGAAHEIAKDPEIRRAYLGI